MAAVPAAAGEPSSIKELKNALHTRCSQAPSDKLFTQEDLLDMGVIPDRDPAVLIQCVNELLGEKLMNVLIKGSLPLWRVVKKVDADRYQSMTADEAMIYSYIESSGREGIWSRTIKNKTNFHQSIMTRSIKSLEGRNYIKSIKSVKWPTRIIYMLAHLTPSEDVTGGPWFTDGELDTDFVEVLTKQIEKYIISKSFRKAPVVGPTHPAKKAKTPTTKTPAPEPRRVDSVGQKPRSEQNIRYLPHAPNYASYPTLAEIVAWLNQTNITTVTLEEEHVRQLLDILYYDRKIEKIGGDTAYKAVRPLPAAKEGATTNGLSEAPCGRCPVFMLCEDDGPVSARNCDYFRDWLEM
ncbi:MAG: 34-kDa subunit of RNA polymerase III (C) [Caeruleum heppii]|nr:MAG: 34-kDa subunit of RNA polymerase III (C) [Caeruleum heppii]